jgi:hypothetical protein
VPYKLHYIVLTHAFLRPVADGCPPEIMELTFLNAGPLQNLAEITTKIVDYLVLLKNSNLFNFKAYVNSLNNDCITSMAGLLRLKI